MKRTPTFALIGIMLVALGIIAATAVVAWRRSRHGTVRRRRALALPRPLRSAGVYTRDHDGDRVTDATYRGRFLFVYFGYGYCPDICPTELANMAAILDHMGASSERVQALFVTVDPARDTPKFLAEYVAQFHPKMVGLTGTDQQIADIAKKYRVFYRKAEDASASEYLMDHSNFFYLMGPDGKFLSMFRGGTDPAAIAETIANYVENYAVGA